MARPYGDYGRPVVVDPQLPFLDPLGHLVAIQDVLFDDSFNVYDQTQIRFGQNGDLYYRGKLYSPKEDLSNLPIQFRVIYASQYPPKQEADFTTFRNNTKSDSSSSRSSRNSKQASQQDAVNEAMPPVTIDDTDAAGLLETPINIDGAVPLSQAYKQFEPQGYKLIADLQPIDGQFKTMSQLAPTVGGLSRKRKHFGLSPEEVVMFGGLSCTPCRPSNLSDPFKTTLFQQQNFYNTPQDVYDLLTPALKLAEKMIIDRTQIAYWSTLAFGKRDIDLQLTASRKICHERLTGRVSVTDDIYEQTVHLLNRLGKLVEYHFSLTEQFKDHGCYGYTQKSDRRWNLATEHHEMFLLGNKFPSDKRFPLGRWYPKDPWDDNQVINLHPDFFTAAKRFINTKNQDVAARLRFNFWFAINICHELAHVFELKSSQANFERSAASCQTFDDFKTLVDPRFAAGTIEAFWGNSTWAEAGGQWEWNTFGGRVHPISRRTDASLGMMIYNADGFANVAVPARADTAVGTCIQMGFMEEVQQQSFWCRPKRTLKFPLKTGARAFLYPLMSRTSFRDHLRERDETLASQTNVTMIDLSHTSLDLDDISLGRLLTDALNEDETSHIEDPPAKRRKVDGVSSVTKTRSNKTLPQRGRLGQRLGQPLIRHFAKKTDADPKTVREEAIAVAAREEAERDRDSAAERAAAEQARRYRAPPAGQKELHEFFRYPEEKPQDDLDSGTFVEDYVDPVTKKPEDLTLADKWKIAEEYYCLLMTWEPVEFLGQRYEHADWRPMWPFNPDDPTHFKQENLDFLISFRQSYPGQSWPERRAREKALYEQKRDIAQRLAMADELLTHLGYSRIECHRMLGDTGVMPMGMTLANFAAYKPLLDAFRLTQQVQSTGEFQTAVDSGSVVAGATGIGLVTENGKLKSQAQAALDQGPTAKITDYFAAVKATPGDARASTSRSDELPRADPAPFPPLTKVPTPEELVRKYEAWVAVGMDMCRVPQGLHPAQLLNKNLGGSLQMKKPIELARVVEERRARLEVEAEEKRRVEVKSRAEAAEERRRSVRRAEGRSSGSGSGSGEGEL